jgi:Domain of unknown function (DUF4412)
VTEEELSEEELEANAKKKKRAIVKIAIALFLVLGSLGAWLYTRYGVQKAELGGPCMYALHCRKEAATCLRLSLDDKGACSRSCEVGTDCAPGIPCVKVGLGEYDDRGMPLEGGYCIPQTLIDARKKGRSDGGADDGGAKLDSWLPVPVVPAQLEGEVTFQNEKKGVAVGEPRSFLVKGTLLRPSPAASNGRKRTIVDTNPLRVFSIDDEKQTFAISALGGSPGDVKVTKTGRMEKLLDRDCEIWKLDEARATREACIVQGGTFMDPAARVAAPWARELAVRDAFPLRVVELDSAGHEVSRLVVVRFDVHPIEASLFAVPHSYKNLAGR